jgi:hypothetical protein
MLSTAHDGTPVNTSILVPLDIEKKNILYYDNPASVLGILHDLTQYYTRVGLFETFIAHRACNLGTKIIIEDRASIPFILGMCWSEEYDLITLPRDAWIQCIHGYNHGADKTVL